MDTNNIGAYNLKVYEKYVRRWAEKVIQFKREDERALGLNKLVIPHLGDWLEGENIYAGQAFHICENLAV